MPITFHQQSMEKNNMFVKVHPKSSPHTLAPVGPEVFIKRSVIEVSTKPGVKEQLWMPQNSLKKVVHPCGFTIQIKYRINFGGIPGPLTVESEGL